MTSPVHGRTHIGGTPVTRFAADDVPIIQAGGVVAPIPGDALKNELFAASLAVDWNNGNNQRIVLANGDNAITLANPRPGRKYTLILKQPASGVRGTVTWPAAVRWSGGMPPGLTPTNSGTDVVTLVYDGTGTVYYGTGVPDLAAGGSAQFVDFVNTNTVWPVPAGVTSITIETFGGGGGGGLGSTGTEEGGGGGGGGYAKKVNFAVTPGQVLSVVAGAGGGSAAPGQDSKVLFGAAILCHATGGGVGGNSGSGTGGAGGTAGAGVVGDLFFTGGAGGTCIAGTGPGGGGGGGAAGSAGNGATGNFGIFSGSGLGGVGGTGNPGPGGTPGRGGDGGGGFGSPGAGGFLYGGGGGGAGQSSGTGGAGAHGLVRISWTLPSPSDLIDQIEFGAAGSFSFVVPPRATAVTLECWGAGGGAGGLAFGNNSGAGGGGGGYARTENLPVVAGQTLALTVGAGGAGSIGATPAGNGGDTSIAVGANLLCRATGGGGATNPSNDPIPGLGGVGNVGSVFFSGGNGGDGEVAGSGGGGGGGGAGASSNGANGVSGSGSSGAGGAGGTGNPGAGGAGGAGTNSGTGAGGLTAGGGGGGSGDNVGGAGAVGYARVSWALTLPFGEATGKKQPVRAATTAALPASTYNNGTAGVGATITITANGAFPAQDGATLGVGERLLVKNEAAPERNGIYVLARLGDGSTQAVLARASDAALAESLLPSTEVAVQEGAVNKDTSWQLVTNGPITIGTTGLEFRPVTAQVRFSVTAIKTGASESVEFGETARVNTDTNAVAVELPNAAGRAGEQCKVKDVSGTAATNNITVNRETGSGQLIDGAVSYVINVAYGSATFESDGTNWMIV